MKKRAVLYCRISTGTSTLKHSFTTSAKWPNLAVKRLSDSTDSGRVRLG
jgi:hypothetical protein